MVRVINDGDHSYSEEGLVKEGDVLFKVVLGLLVDPLLEVVEVEGVGVLDLALREPLVEVGEVVTHFLPVEDAVYHVAAEQSQLDLVPRVRVDLLVLVDALEDVRGRRPVRKFQIVEGFLVDLRLVALLEVFNRHFSKNMADFVVDILEQEMSFHIFLF